MLYDAFVLNDAASQKKIDSEYPTYNDRVNVFHKELFRNASQCCIDLSVLELQLRKFDKVTLLLHVIDVISCAIQMDIS